MKKTLSIAWLVMFALIVGVQAQNSDVFEKENIKAKMLKVADWQLKNPNHEPNDWTNGAFYAGVFAAYETTKSPEIMNALTDLGKQTNWQSGKRFDHADDIVINQTYLDVYRLKKYQKMLQPTIDAIKRLQTGKSVEAEKHGITWWWCDALFMAPPTLAKLSKTTGDKNYLALNDKLFQETIEVLRFMTTLELRLNN